MENVGAPGKAPVGISAERIQVVQSSGRAQGRFAVGIWSDGLTCVRGAGHGRPARRPYSFRGEAAAIGFVAASLTPGSLIPSPSSLRPHPFTLTPSPSTLNHL